MATVDSILGGVIPYRRAIEGMHLKGSGVAPGTKGKSLPKRIWDGSTSSLSAVIVDGDGDKAVSS
jgi:hypothetical protein